MQQNIACRYPFETTLKLHVNYTLSVFLNTKYEISAMLFCAIHPKIVHSAEPYFPFSLL